MRKLFFFPLLFLFWTSSYSQAGCYSEQPDSYWKIGLTQYGSKKLSNCDPAAYYNCHGFVIAYLENNCTAPGWNNPFIPTYSCPNSQGIKAPSDYQNSGKYVQVCNESDGDVIFYDLSVDGDHSAIKENLGGGQIRYLSKYGPDGPLVAHKRDSSFYHLNGLVIGAPQFWAFVGRVLGSTQIVGTSPVTFSVPTKPGVTYSWSLVEGLSKVFISGGANQSTVTLTPTHSGTAKLRLTINSVCGSPRSQEISLNIQTNVCVEGAYNLGGNTCLNLNTTNQVGIGNLTSTVTCPNVTSFTWQRTSGSITSFSTSGPYVNFNVVSGGSISFLITAKNGATTLASRNVSFFNFGSFRLYPNPSSSKFTIDLSEELRFNLSIESLNSKFRMEVKDYQGGNEVDISQLESGEYIINISYEGKVVKQERLWVTK